MIFRTSLKLSEDKAFGIEIDLPQLPCAYIHGDNIQEIDIMGSYYTVIQILYHHGGKVELILHCKTPKIGGIHKDLLLLEYNGTGESLVQLSIKSSIFPNNMEMVFDILKIPETKLEFIEKRREGI